jgi:putative Holliday junction resolvase
MRIISIDPGETRWGVAVSDEDGEFASPRDAFLPKTPAEGLTLVAELAREEGAQIIVLGLPLDMRGTEGISAKKSRTLAAQLAKVTRVRIALWDERLTTVEASRSMRAQGINAKKQRSKIDSAAATILLQSFLDASPATRQRALIAQKDDAAPQAPK